MANNFSDPDDRPLPPSSNRFGHLRSHPFRTSNHHPPTEPILRPHRHNSLVRRPEIPRAQRHLQRVSATRFLPSPLRPLLHHNPVGGYIRIHEFHQQQNDIRREAPSSFLHFGIDSFNIDFAYKRVSVRSQKQDPEENIPKLLEEETDEE